MSVSFSAQMNLKPVDLANSDVYRRELTKASKEFESVLIAQMFKIMRDTVPRVELFGDSNGRDFYEDLFYTEIAREGSLGGGFGFADIIYGQLSQNIDGAPREAGQSPHPDGEVTL